MEHVPSFVQCSNVTQNATNTFLTLYMYVHIVGLPKDIPCNKYVPTSLLVLPGLYSFSKGQDENTNVSFVVSHI